MAITLNIYKGKPHKDGEPLICCRCNAGLKWPYDMMEDNKGNRWLYCEACSVEMISSFRIETDH